MTMTSPSSHHHQMTNNVVVVSSLNSNAKLNASEGDLHTPILTSAADTHTTSQSTKPSRRWFLLFWFWIMKIDITDRTFKSIAVALASFHNRSKNSSLSIISELFEQQVSKSLNEPVVPTSTTSTDTPSSSASSMLPNPSIVVQPSTPATTSLIKDNQQQQPKSILVNRNQSPSISQSTAARKAVYLLVTDLLGDWLVDFWDLFLNYYSSDADGVDPLAKLMKEAPRGLSRRNALLKWCQNRLCSYKVTFFSLIQVEFWWFFHCLGCILGYQILISILASSSPSFCLLFFFEVYNLSVQSWLLVPLRLETY